jgi:hypothetical protein
LPTTTTSSCPVSVSEAAAVRLDDRDGARRALAADLLGTNAGKLLAGKDVCDAVVPEEEGLGLGLDADADADADVLVDAQLHEVVSVGGHGRGCRLRPRP